MEEVILVDKDDNQIGTMEKLAAHQNGGKWHRAFSVFVFNDNNETMLQRRALTKYHTPGKWTNACCSHQRVGESTLDAAHRRLKEEMGFDCDLHEVFNFPYQAYVEKGLTENEYDHIVFGKFTGKPSLNKEEACDWKWISIPELQKEIKNSPENFTPWLRLMIYEVAKNMDKLDTINKKQDSKKTKI